MSAVPAAAPLQRWAVAGFGAITVAAWLLLHLYRGIQHDAVLYTMQGLSHLHPNLYANDVFLKYGSQDRYTLFGSLYGALIGLLGVDLAAAVTTLLSQAALLWCSWRLARRYMPADQSMLAVALLTVLELHYGSGGIFTALEDFMTPRPLAEALVLTAITAEVSGRRWIACLSLLIAGLLHPVMALAGVAWLGGTIWIQMRWRAVIAAAMLLMLALGLYLCRRFQPPLPIVNDWFAMAISRAPYLILKDWSSVDWAHLCPPCATLLIAALTTQSISLRRLCVVCVVVGIVGVLTTLVGADLLHIVLVLQIQPWRCVWLGVVLAVIVLPSAMQRLWSLGALGRATLALLAALYAFQDEIYCAWLVILALGVCWLCCNGSRIAPRTQNLVLWGSVGVFLLALVWDVANRFVYIKVPYFLFHGMPRVTLLRQLTRDSILPAVLLIALWCLAFRWRRRTGQAIALAVGAAALALMLPIAWQRLSTPLFPSQLYRSFDRWRSQIPEGAQVLWIGNPLEAWVLLERPSFYTEQQRTTTLFSREAASVLRERYYALEVFLQNEGGAAFNSRYGNAERPELTLGDVCAAPGMQFVVTHHRFKSEPTAVLPDDLPAPFGKLQLFACTTAGKGG